MLVEYLSMLFLTDECGLNKKFELIKGKKLLSWSPQHLSNRPGVEREGLKRERLGVFEEGICFSLT